MSPATLTAPPRGSTSPLAAGTRPGLGRLTRVELRKMLDTRAGFWLQVAVVAITVVAVVVLLIIGEAKDQTLPVVMSLALAPAGTLLPIVGILLVTSEWSQRTGMITFALVPIRSRVLSAKLLACLVVAVAALAVCLAIGAVALVVADPGVERTWSVGPALLGQYALYLATAMATGLAFGALLLASAPAIVLYFALPLAWAALVSLSFFADVAPWLDTARALTPMTEEVMSATQWAHAGTALALWLLLPGLVGIWRITRREVSA